MRMFDMLTSEDIKRIKKDPEIRIKELENSLSIALETNDRYQRENALLLKSRPLNTMDEVAYRELEAENKNLKKKVRDAEGETSIVKAVGINSPEMKALRKENEELKADLARAHEDHQFDNLAHKKELESLRDK
jgi:hypothetical protein